ncbi:hypothetical protein IPH92_02250 [Candidatus Kaiserbacteria bacterium]|nr:MAG: hypothetical protein IPH92_02250 [Candidatus Kaiserbacteria bacterium]
MIAYAAGGAHITAAKAMLAKIESAILFPLMTLMMAVAFFIFIWGAYQFVLNADDDTKRTEGKAHMLYGIIGLLVMVSAMAILTIALGTVGVTI